MYFTLLVVVILTAIALVAVAVGNSPVPISSPFIQLNEKGEAYECGIPTAGTVVDAIQSRLLSICYPLPDVRCGNSYFLFPWAVVVQDLGVYGLFSILFFLVILVLGLAYAWKKGALEWK